MNRREFIAGVAGVAAATTLIVEKKEVGLSAIVLIDGILASENHPARQLIDFSLAHSYVFEWIERLGSAYLLKGRNGFGLPVILSPISPQFVMKSSDGFRIQARYFGSKIWEVPADDMIEVVTDRGFFNQDALVAYSVALTNGLKKDFGDGLHISLEASV